MKRLYLTSKPNPPQEDWDIVHNFDEFVFYIETNGLPDKISFGHDLGENNDNKKSGYDCAKWLCEYCWFNGLPFPHWDVHSSNPVGRYNIIQLLEGFERKLDF